MFLKLIIQVLFDAKPHSSQQDSFLFPLLNPRWLHYHVELNLSFLSFFISIMKGFIWFPKMVVPPKTPQVLIIFSRNTPWLLGKPTILGNHHIPNPPKKDLNPKPQKRKPETLSPLDSTISEWVSNIDLTQFSAGQGLLPARCQATGWGGATQPNCFFFGEFSSKKMGIFWGYNPLTLIF